MWKHILALTRRAGQQNLIAIALKMVPAGVLSEIAFHEKAGRSQVSFLFDTVFPSAELATVAMLPFALSKSDSFARCRLGVLGSAGAAI
jgi:hypothetical protein